MLLSITCVVMLNPKEIKFLRIGNFEAGFHLNRKWFPRSKTVNLKKLSLLLAPSQSHESRHDIHPGGRSIVQNLMFVRPVVWKELKRTHRRNSAL